MPGSLTVSGSDSLLTASVVAFLREIGYSAIVVPGPQPTSGVRVASEATRRWMYVSAHSGPDAAAVAALSEGASATVNLDTSPEEAALAVGSLIDGGRGYVPIDMMRWIAGEAMAKGGPSRPALTLREREVLRLVARGFSNGEIATALTISTNTVRTHLHTLSLKLEANSRTRMLANARALAYPEAFDAPVPTGSRGARVPA